MRRVLLFVGAFGVLLVRCRYVSVTLLHLRGCLVVAFQTRKLRIILMKFHVMCVFSWVFLAALLCTNYGLLSSICGVEVLMCVLQALSIFIP
jgi:hypothetical protein